MAMPSHLVSYYCRQDIFVLPDVLVENVGDILVGDTVRVCYVYVTCMLRVCYGNIPSPLIVSLF